jgi:transposase
MQVTTIGLDLAKHVFQIHGIDATEKVVVRRQLRRSQVMAFFEALAPCLIGIEACATAHYWARELTKLGHEVRLMPAKDVKAYVKRNKNDAADAEAICEAVRRPTMRFVRVKSAEQQGQLMQHRTRDLLMRQRTQVINALRARLDSVRFPGGSGLFPFHNLSFLRIRFCRPPNRAAKGALGRRGPSCHHEDKGLSVYPVFAKNVASARARSSIARTLSMKAR